MKRRPKILYMELLDNNYGHKRLDTQVIKVLQSISDLTVAQPEGWFDTLPDSVDVYSYNNKVISNNKKVSYYKRNIYNLMVASKLDKKKRFDFLFFASYETYVMGMIPFKIHDISNRVFILHHNNIDLIDKSSKLRFFFERYAKRVNHVVLEEFIGDHLNKEYGVDSSKIFYMPYPLNEVQGEKFKQYDCVGISNSNNEEWIEEIVDYEKNSRVFETNNIKVVLRSKTIAYDDGFLKVINDYLSDENYYQYIKGAKTIFLPFPESFKYRTSGSVMDAFSNETSVLGSRILLFQNIANKYPEICVVLDSAQNFINYLIDPNLNLQEKQKEFKTFKNLHSEDELRKALVKMFYK